MPTSNAVAKFPESPYLSAEGLQMREEIRGLLPLLAEHAAETERLGTLAPATLDALDRTGVFRVTIPVELGGSAFGARDTAEVVRLLGRADAAAGWTVIVSTAARNALGFDPRARDEVFADVDTWVGPIVFGATVFAPKVGDGRRVDGGFMVKGRWHFGSSCKSAAWGCVGFEYDDQETGTRRRAMALLAKGQYTIVDDWHVMGLAGTSSNSVQVDEELFVPDYRVVHTADLPRLMDGLRGAYQGVAFMHSAIGTMIATTVAFAALALGMAEGALAAFVEQAAKRAPFNLPYATMGEMASIHVVAGKARAVINAADAVISRYADEVDRRALAGEDFGPQDEPEITMDLVHQIHECRATIDGLQLALGSSTVPLTNPIQRYVRDIHVLATHGAFRIDPSAEITGRELFGLGTPPPLGAGPGTPPPLGAGPATPPPFGAGSGMPPLGAGTPLIPGPPPGVPAR